MICTACGLVVGDRIVDVGSEWRTFSDSNNDPSRVGAAENPLLENDLSTRIGASAGSEYHNRSSMSSANRTIISAIRDINEIAEKANIPKTITDEAAGWFRRVYEQKRLRNRPRQAIVSACLYLACRMNGAPRSFRELSAITGMAQPLIAKCFKAITKSCTNERITAQVDACDFLLRFCSSLGLSVEVQRLATDIATVAKEKSIIDGRNPTSVAAAVIYMASQVSDAKKSQKEISEVAGCAESTIKQSYRVLLSRAAELIPPESRFHSRIHQLPAS